MSQLVISEIVLEECGAFELKSNFKKETDNNYLEVFDYNQIIYEGKLKKSYLYSILKKNQWSKFINDCFLVIMKKLQLLISNQTKIESKLEELTDFKSISYELFDVLKNRELIKKLQKIEDDLEKNKKKL